MRKISFLITCLLLAALLCVCVAAETFVNPVANGADPYVFKDTDGTYYLYVTSGGSYGYRVYTSTNLVEWEAKGYCLRRDDVYTDQVNNAGVYNFWAPEIIKLDDTYYMIYSAQEHIGIATSDSPLGPFRNTETSFLMEDKAIDGHFFLDDDGQLYVYFVSIGAWDLNGGSVSTGNNIWGGPFDIETLTFDEGYPQLLIEYDTGEGHVVAEGPEMLKKDGTYYLTYSSGDYRYSGYSVKYATSSDPVGTFTKYSGNPILKSDDVGYNDPTGDHLYGTAHHCFTTSPDGTQMYIVYHAHRSSTPNVTESIADATEDCSHTWITTNNQYMDNGTVLYRVTDRCLLCSGVKTTTYERVEERRICIDKAWFDDNGILHAGTLTDGVPSATAQDVPSGGELTRSQNLEGTPFETISTLPTVYVSQKDGLDTNAGTEAAPLKTLAAAYAALPSGGTIVLTQLYQCETVFTAPAVNGPIMIKGAFSAVPLAFKFIQLNSDTYFDNVALFPQTANSISVIECNFHNVTMGEGVSCIAQPTRKTFPYIVGGKWWSTNTSDSYSAFNQYTSDAEITSDAEYTINVLSGTWTAITKASMKSTTVKDATGPNATLTVSGDALYRPGKAAAPTVKLVGEGAELTFKAVAHAVKYAIYKDDALIGYADGTTYVDTAYNVCETSNYAVVAYVNGACFGDTSTATAFVFDGDYNADGSFGVKDIITLLKNVANGSSESSLRDVLVLFKNLVK